MTTTVDAILVKQFVDEPEQLLELVRAILTEMKTRYDEAGSPDAEKKLLKISKLIEDFEANDLEVPDNLRRLKLDLVAEVEGTQDRREEYIEVLTGLRQVLDASGAPLNVTRHGGNQEAGQDDQAPKRRRRNRKDLTPQDVLGNYLVEVLREAGGSAPKREMLKRIGEKYSATFKAGDFETRSSGEIIWENNTAWARWKLIQQGVMKSDSPTGTWELSEDQR